MTRLLWLIDSFNVGGAESLVVPFVRNYDRSRYELVLACLTSIDGNPIERELATEGVSPVNLGAKNLRDRAAFRRLLALIRDQKIDLIHAHLTYASTWAALASRITGVPSVATLHVAPPTTGAAAVRDRILRFALNRWSSRVLMVSGALRDMYAKRGGLRAAKMTAVHNGIDVQRFRRNPSEVRRRLESEFDIPAAAPIVMTVSVLRPGKGIEVLIDAIPKVVATIPNAVFLIAGDGPMRDEWTSRATAAGVGDRIRWAGYRRDVEELLAGADLFVLPSLADAFPTVLLEAMAAGVPAVASNVGGIPEIIQNGRTGTLVPPGDADALARGIASLLSDAAARERMRATTPGEAERRFSTAAWLRRLDDVYADVVPSNALKTKPRIAMIEFAGKGGMIHYAFQLCRGFAARGADVTLVTSREYELEELEHPFRIERIIDLWDPKPAGRLSNAPWAVAGRKIRRVFRAARYYGEWFRAIRYVRDTKPDIVLLGDVRFPFDLFALRLLRRQTRFFVDICHNVHPFAAGGKAGGLFDRSASKRWFYRRIYRLFDFVFVHYDRNRREFIETFGFDSKRVGTIVHGNEEIFRDLRDPSVSASALRRRLGIGEKEPVVLFFGTLSRYKGTDTLIRSFPKIQAATGARLVLAGFPFHDFNLAEHQELTRSLGIDKNVVWVPEYVKSEEIAAWMELASVIVFPYRDIYQSGALHVPQTFGVPIVASAIGAMQDVIENEVSGLLVPPENEDALAEAVTRLLENPELASRLGARAAADAQGRFAWTTIAGTILDAIPLTRERAAK